MNSLDWNLVQSFVAVAEHGSYSAAGRHLGLSQPTIGRHIDMLEQQLDVILFQPVTKGFTLSETGLKLMAHAQHMQQAAVDFRLSAAGQVETLEGTVRITASEMVATYTLPPLLKSLRDQAPYIQLEVVASNQTENLLLREADIAVRMAEPTQGDLIARKIADVPIGLFGSSTYLKACDPPTSFDAWRDYDLIGYDRSELMLNGMKKLGLTISRNDFCFRTDSHLVYLHAIAAGIGIGAVQQPIAKKLGLEQLLPELPLPPLPCWLVVHAELKTNPRVRFVYDFLSTHLQKALLS